MMPTSAYGGAYGTRKGRPLEPQDVPVRIRVTLYPDDQANLHDLTERLDRPEGQVIRDALAAYRHHLDVTARLRGAQLADKDWTTDPARTPSRVNSPRTEDPSVL